VNNLRKLISKPKFYFLAIVPLLLATAFIQVTCPICGGRGTISESVGMENIRIVSSDARILSVTQDACTMFVVVKAKPNLTIANTGNTDAQGWLKMDLIDPHDNKVLASQYVAVEVAANTFANLEYPVAFGYDAATAPSDIDIAVSVLNDNAPCVACQGTGKVPLNMFFLDKAYKNRLIQAVQAQQQFLPDQRIGTEEWHYMMED